MFFVLFSFDASVLKNKNNISEVNYDDHCYSGRRNSPSLMLLAFFSTDASKQKQNDDDDVAEKNLTARSS